MGGTKCFEVGGGGGQNASDPRFSDFERVTISKNVISIEIYIHVNNYVSL